MNNKIIMSILFLTGCTPLLKAQSAFETEDASEKKFYIKINGGYGVFTPGSYRLETRTTYPYTTGNGIRDTTISTLGKNGMGQGVRFGGGIGYIINNFLNVGIDVEYLKGNQLTSTKSYIQSSSQYRSFGSSTLDYHVLTLNPHVIFKAKSSSNYYIYNRLGVLLSLPFDLSYESYDSTTNSSLVSSVRTPQVNPTSETTVTNTSKTVRTVTGNYYNPLSFGLNVALGVQFKITGNLRGFVEAFANYTVLTPSENNEISEAINTSINTTTVKNLLNNTSTSSTKTSISISKVNNIYNYQKEGGVSYVYTPDPSVNSTPVTVGTVTTTRSAYTYTQTLPSISRNMNAIGINLGVAVRF